MKKSSRAKITILGPSKDGKTQLYNALSDQGFDNEYKSSDNPTSTTLNHSYRNYNFKFEIYDTTGDSDYYHIISSVSNSSDIILFVYDITSRSSLDFFYSLPVTIDQSATKFLVGTHLDDHLRVFTNPENNPQPQREVQKVDLNRLVTLYNISSCHCIEVSSKTKANISQLLNEISQATYEKFGLHEEDSSESSDSDICYKPVIYLYPPEPMRVSVNIELDGHMMYTYPRPQQIGTEKYQWEVEANPGSRLTIGNRHYDSLFWEGTCNTNYDLEKGFHVEGKDAISFLEEKLRRLGLNEREMNEFIVFWMPIMEANRFNLISFQFERYTDHAKLEITPQPDHVIRVYIVCKKLNETEMGLPIEEQILPEIRREDLHGFVAVEWGGTRIE